MLWTYETIVATDFLPRISAEAALQRVAPAALHAYVRGATPTSTLPLPAGVHTFLYSCTPGLGDDAVIRIPHEFAVAAFRLGHSLVRDDYVLHDIVRDSGGNILTGQPRPIFAAAGQAETLGLVGDNPLQPGDVIDWSYFFDFGGATAQATRPLDTLISDKLFSLPVAALPPGPAPDGKDTPSERNLPRRNLLRASEPNSVLTGSVGLATGEEAERYAQRRIPGLDDATAAVKSLLAERLKNAGFKPDALSGLTPLVALCSRRSGKHPAEPAPRRTRQPHRRRIPARLFELRHGLGALCGARRLAGLGPDRGDRAKPPLFDAGADRLFAGERHGRRAADPAIRPLARPV